MSSEIALPGYLLACIVCRLRNEMGSGRGVLLQRRRHGKKATGVPLVPTWNDLFPFGFKLQGLGNKKGNRRRGRRFRRLQVSRISPALFLSACFTLSLLLCGINTFQRMGRSPLTGERALHSGIQNSCKGACYVGTVDGYVCVILIFLPQRFCWQVNICSDFQKVSGRALHRLRSWHLISQDFDKSEEVELYRFCRWADSSKPSLTWSNSHRRIVGWIQSIK